MSTGNGSLRSLLWFNRNLGALMISFRSVEVHKMRWWHLSSIHVVLVLHEGIGVVRRELSQ